MPFEFPDNLHPDCGPVAWLLGTWGGRGNGDYPTLEAYSYGQELVFAHDGRPFLHYFSRTWVLDEAGERVGEGELETGFLRCRPDRRLELLLTHPTGVAEIYYGEAETAKFQLTTDAVVRTESAQEVTAATRLYGYVEGDLLYAVDVAADGQALQPRLWARLERQR